MDYGELDKVIKRVKFLEERLEWIEAHIVAVIEKRITDVEVRAQILDNRTIGMVKCR